MTKQEQKKSIMQSSTALSKDQNEDQVIRPSVVAILGHIDHGKSTLIDYIRKTNVTGKEAGGITQHISAYEIIHTTKDGRNRKITFIDTPGHEAFGGIRTRSTNVADIAVLVVSAEDGVKPQTLEIIKYIKECSLPFIVVITKIDKPTADILKTKQNLAENDIFVEGYGGDTPVIELSAKTGNGVDEFLDMIILMSDLENKTASVDTLGSGVIIETRRDAKRGITAVGIIKNGTIRQSLFASSRGAITPIRFLMDSEGNTVDELSFSSPVQIAGWDNMPIIGEKFKTFLKKDEALSFASSSQETSFAKTRLENSEGKDVVMLPLIIKADTSGSLEALTTELKKLSRERISPKIVLASVGNINENDVKSALATTEAIILGFNTKIDSQSALLAERLGVTVIVYSIIYEFIDKVKELLLKREPRVEVEEVISSSKVLKIFDVTKGKQVIGGRVLSGQLKKGVHIKIIRRETEIGKGKIQGLQQSKIVTESAGEGTEFGAMIESKIEVVPGDILNAVALITK